MKKMIIRFVRRKNESDTAYFETDVMGFIDGRNLTLSNKSITDLIIKILYYNYDNILGEIAFGSALGYVVLDDEIRRLDSISNGKISTKPNPNSFVRTFAEEIFEKVKFHD